MPAQSTAQSLSFARDAELSTGQNRPTLTLVTPTVSAPVVNRPAVYDTPEYRVCLGCKAWKCHTPRSCAAAIAAMAFRPCSTCRGIGAVRVDGPGLQFIDCEPCDGLGLIEVGSAA